MCYFQFVQKISCIENKPSFMCNSPLISTSKITNHRNRIVNKLDYVLTRTRKTSVNDTISSVELIYVSNVRVKTTNNMNVI